jgi:hypothetical protein
MIKVHNNYYTLKIGSFQYKNKIRGIFGPRVYTYLGRTYFYTPDCDSIQKSSARFRFNSIRGWKAVLCTRIFHRRLLPEAKHVFGCIAKCLQ